MKTEKGLYLFLKVLSIVCAVAGTILIGLGVFSILIPGGLFVAGITFTCGGALLGAVKAMVTSCEKLKTKF